MKLLDSLIVLNKNPFEGKVFSAESKLWGLELKVVFSFQSEINLKKRTNKNQEKNNVACFFNLERQIKFLGFDLEFCRTDYFKF